MALPICKLISIIRTQSIATFDLLGCNRWHIEVARGNPSDNKTYCSKDEEFVEGGVLPVSNNDRFAAVRDIAQAERRQTCTCYWRVFN